MVVIDHSSHKAERRARRIAKSESHGGSDRGGDPPCSHQTVLERGLPAITVGQSPAMAQEWRHRGQAHAYRLRLNIESLTLICVQTSAGDHSHGISPRRHAELVAEGGDEAADAVVPQFQRNRGDT